VGGSEAKKGPGPDLLVRYFLRVLELPSPRNAQKRDKKKPRKNRFGIFDDFFVKTCRHDLKKKATFFVVFLNSHRRETTEKAIKQKSQGETDIEILLMEKVHIPRQARATSWPPPPLPIVYLYL
jgi:hypothetical protein